MNDGIYGQQSAHTNYPDHNNDGMNNLQASERESLGPQTLANGAIYTG